MKTEKERNKNYVIEGEFVTKSEEKQGGSKSRLGRRKKIAAVLGLALSLGMTGCAGAETASENTQEEENSGGKTQADGGAEDSSSDDAATQEGEWEREEPVPAQERESADTDVEEQEKPPEGSQETVHLGGKAQSPQVDGMTLAQTTLTDEDGMVTLLDVKDAKKIPVKFTADTKVEHWTIQGGGAGIDMREAAVSELVEGMGVELEGYFDGETFVATRVIMEVYV